MTAADPIAVLRALIEREALNEPDAGYHGIDWWQLAEQEEEVFDIDPAEMPMMVTTWSAYEAFAEIAEGGPFDMEHGAVIDAAKAARPELAGMPQWEKESWMAFAREVLTVSQRQAWKWWAKHEAWMLRADILTFGDEH